MKALSICQPYASLIVLPDDHDRAKRVENRTWSTYYRGKLLIHAGKGTSYLETYDWRAAGITQLPMGAIIGVCVLDGCVPATQYQGAPRITELAQRKWPWLELHEHLEGPIAWVLRECRAIKPIPCAGKQGLWNPSAEIMEKLREEGL